MEHVKLHDMSPPKKYLRIIRVWIWIECSFGKALSCTNDTIARRGPVKTVGNWLWVKV